MHIKILTIIFSPPIPFKFVHNSLSLNGKIEQYCSFAVEEDDKRTILGDFFSEVCCLI